MRLWGIGFGAARIAAIFIATRIVGDLISRAQWLWEADADRWLTILASAIGLAVAAWLWRAASTFADHIAFDADEQRPEDVGAGPPAIPFVPTMLAALAFAIVGVVLAVDGLVSSIWNIGTLIADHDDGLFQLDRYVRGQSLAGTAAGVIKVLIGIALFANRERLASIIHPMDQPTVEADAPGD